MQSTHHPLRTRRLSHGASVCPSLCALVALAGCVAPAQHGKSTPSVDAVFTVRGAGSQHVVRALTSGSQCPSIHWSDGHTFAMQVRAQPASVAASRSGGQPGSKAAVFDVLTCEAELSAPSEGPPTAATVGGLNVPLPHRDIRRIALIGDTGCRMKASEKAFQACNDAAAWPFAAVARSAAAKQPDLVVHLGDLHYRESPCPAGNAGCAGSAWGYGYDAWRADLFAPAQPLLAAAPWVFVRGNHESCFRAGQGWFRFVDAGPYAASRTCDQAEFDSDGDFTEPYAMPIGDDTQLIVFDSSRSSGKPYAENSPALLRYVEQMKRVEQLSRFAAENFFLSHHPLLAYAPLSPHAAEAGPKEGGSGGLISAFERVHGNRLFPEGVQTVMHGHIHLFEALSFSSNHPASFVLGNSGSATEGRAPERIVGNAQPLPGARLEHYAGHSAFGFALLERVGNDLPARWQLTDFDVNGQPIVVCQLQSGKSRCQ